MSFNTSSVDLPSNLILTLSPEFVRTLRAAHGHDEEAFARDRQRAYDFNARLILNQDSTLPSLAPENWARFFDPNAEIKIEKITGSLSQQAERVLVMPLGCFMLLRSHELVEMALPYLPKMHYDPARHHCADPFTLALVNHPTQSALTILGATPLFNPAYRLRFTWSKAFQATISQVPVRLSLLNKDLCELGYGEEFSNHNIHHENYVTFVAKAIYQIMSNDPKDSRVAFLKTLLVELLDQGLRVTPAATQHLIRLNLCTDGSEFKDLINTRHDLCNGILRGNAERISAKDICVFSAIGKLQELFSVADQRPE